MSQEEESRRNAERIRAERGCYVIPPYSFISELKYAVLTTSGPVMLYIVTFLGGLSNAMSATTEATLLNWTTYTLLIMMLLSVIWASLAAFFRWTYAWRAFLIHMIIMFSFLTVSTMSKFGLSLRNK